ncbi:MAG: protealysin inhibitor emfourin [Solirubrobacteraceae bacterium]
MRVQIKRRGGIAGLTLGAELDTEKLDPNTAAQVEHAIENVVASPPAPEPAQPDRFHYEITLPDRGKSVSVSERQLPEDLAPLVEQLADKGEIEPS